MLDSDNGDANLSVMFYENVKRDPPMVYVRIDVPGDKTQVWDQPATDADKQRFPQHWLRYCMDAGNGGVIGTPLAEWVSAQPDVINDNQAMALAAMGFRSVEQVANASDAQLQRIGMGAVGLQQGARSFLRTRDHDANPTELQETKAQLAALQAQMAAVLGRLGGDGGSAGVTFGDNPEKRGPGRPRKADADGQLDADAGNAGHG